MSDTDKKETQLDGSLPRPTEPPHTPTMDAPQENHREAIQAQSEENQTILPPHSESGVNRPGCKEKPRSRNKTSEGKNRVGRSPDGYKRRSQVIEAQIGFQRTLRIANMAVRGTPNKEIADLMQVPLHTVANISSRFQALLSGLNKVEDFKKVRKDILDATHAKLLESVIDDDCIADAGLRDRAWAAESIYKQSRLESGLSTDNKGIHKFISVNKRDLV